ncbi:MAG: YebC/PmpR family DNA-binding transcriptional regulator, partial [Clostridiales bacterium]
IQKAAGVGENESYEEIFYEGYGIGGIAVLCAILTDNRNRTASELRYIFSRNNGNLGETGCVSWMFERKGQINISLEDKDEDEAMMIALEAGADDFAAYGEEGEIITSTDMLEEVRSQFIEHGYNVTSAEITMLPSNTVEINDVEQAAALMKLLDALEDNDDVQDVYANYDISDEIMEQLD